MSRPLEVEPDHKKEQGNENGRQSNNGNNNNGEKVMVAMADTI